MIKYRAFGFRTKAQAEKRQSSIKRRFGYKPSVFRETHRKTGSVRYVVVKPQNIKRIAR